MASGTNNYTAIADLVKGYKKAATKMFQIFRSKVDEFGWFDNVPDLDITLSGRENLIPLDIKRGRGAHMVSDGGMEAVTNSPAPDEASFTPSQVNARFFISTLAQALDQGTKNQLFKKQLKYQSMKSLQALQRRVGLQFYGPTTGYVAQVNGDPGGSATSHTLTLDTGLGDATITDGTYITGLFEADTSPLGDRVALVRSGAIVGSGYVTAKTAATPSIAVTWDAAIDPADNDFVVFANAYNDATITGTDYNKWQGGFLDYTTQTSYLGLSSSSVPAWAAARNSTAGGRWGRAMLKADRQVIHNASDKDADSVILSQGVQNDVEAGEAAGRIYSSSEFDLDQSVKAKGITMRTSPLVPPGHVFTYASEVLWKKLAMDKPGEDASLDWADLYKAEDRSGYKGGFNFVWAHGTNCRGGIARRASLTEQ